MPTNLDTKKFAYDRVANSIKQGIETAVLRPGDKLPSLRTIAKQYHVSMATAVAAMARLEAYRLVEARPRSGYYVRAQSKTPSVLRSRVVATKPREVSVSQNIEAIFSLAQNHNIIKTGLANLSTQILPTTSLNRCIASALRRQPKLLTRYHDVAGDPDLRRLIAQRHLNLGRFLSADDIIITTGATEGLLLALRSLCRRGDVVAIPSPAYFTVLQIIESMGLLAVEIETHPRDGLSVESLREATEKHNIKAVIISATLSNPDGTTMPTAQRQALVALINEKKIPLINDQTMSELDFNPDPPTPLHALDDGGMVITVSSVSKWLAPSLRIGWVLPGAFAEQIIRQKQMTTSNTNILGQVGLAQYLDEGHAQRHLSKLRRNCRTQLFRMLDACDQYLPNPEFVTPSGGFLAWIKLPEPLNTFALFPAAIARGVSYTPGTLFSSQNHHQSHIRLCAYRPWDRSMQQAIQTLGQYFDETLDRQAGSNQA